MATLRSQLAGSLTLAALFLSIGCVPQIISPATLQHVDQTITIEQLKLRPSSFISKNILLGGEIIQTRNTADVTTIMVLALPLDRNRKPLAGSVSGGRFIVRQPSFLDPAIYRPGRKITVAGVVVGEQSLPLGEIIYRYPVIKNRELYLWPEEDYLRQEPAVHFGVGIGIGF
jgi:outer membrane lipoprotein